MVCVRLQSKPASLRCIFLSWLSLSNYHVPHSCGELGARLAAALDEMWQEGNALTYGGHLVSAVKRFLSSSRFCLLLAKQFYSNWRSAHRVRQAVPMPVNVLEAMAMAARAAGQPGLSIVLLLGFFGLLGTTELVTASDSRIINNGTALVVALPYARTSKKEMESVVVRHRLVVRLVADAARGRGGEKFYSCSPSRLRRDLQSLQRALGFGKLFSAYSLRRGGAAAWWPCTTSLVSDILMGRWRDRQTARIYLDSVRACVARSFLTAEQRVRVRECRREGSCCASSFTSGSQPVF